MASRLELSSADRDLLDPGQQAAVRQAKQDFANYQDAYIQAKAAQDAQAMQKAQAGMDSAHAAAEAVRAQGSAISQYSGGADGSQYIPLGSLENGDGPGGRYESDRDGGGELEAPGASLNITGAYRTNTAQMQSQIDEWRRKATAQAHARIDYAVNQAVSNLNRQLEDAQPQFREQAEGVSREERQALDNSALYSELRGDRGGIGKGRYNEIQAQAAANRLAVQQAQTKLATDTARQIEDLRAQGEFDKADAALQISQQYLTQLVDIEQWAANYDLDADQFEASLQQWQAEYDAAMYKFRAENQLTYDRLTQEQNQFDASMRYKYDQLGWEKQTGLAALTGRLPDGTPTLQGQKQLAALGQAMLSAGLMPTSGQLAAMGMTQAQASAALMTAQLKSSGGGSKGSSGSKSSGGKSNSGAALEQDGGERAGIVDSMLALDNDTKAYEYLVGQNLSVSKTDTLWRLYQTERREWSQGGMNEAHFRQMAQGMAASLEQDATSATVSAIKKSLDKYWGKMNKSQQSRIQTLLNRYGVTYH